MKYTAGKELNSVIALFTIASCAGAVQEPSCALTDATAPTNALSYPMTSDRYAVQYSIGGAPWTDAIVHISYYGGTMASPYRGDSGYTLPYQTPGNLIPPFKPPFETSMSFVSIPARANTFVQLRVTKLFGTRFQPSDRVSVRPSYKLADVDTLPDGTVKITTLTGTAFAGEQFVLWWNRGTQGGGLESLAFFLNPPYQSPAGGNVLVVHSWDDLANANQLSYSAIDFEGPQTIKLGSTGAVAYTVPDNIHTIYFADGAWVQGKLRFDPIASSVRTIYGAGVLDVSRFDYLQRVCTGDQTLYALTSTKSTDNLDHFVVDGLVLLDFNHAANHPFYNSTVNNMKALGWNGENAALRIGDGTTVSNVFVRSGDDSLMFWGSGSTISNATVWQNYNGGVVSLGWAANSYGKFNAIEGLYVVKTDWLIPTNPDNNWKALIPGTGVHVLQGQNNGVFTSLMVPTTSYGAPVAPTFRNIFVEDPPQVLFSVKISPPICATTGSSCASVDLHQSSSLNFNIENLLTPASVVDNSIGFETLPATYPNPFPYQPISSDTMLTGSMKIGLTNVFLRLPSGFWVPLTKENATTQGKIVTKGDVTLTFGLRFPN